MCNYSSNGQDPPRAAAPGGHGGGHGVPPLNL